MPALRAIRLLSAVESGSVLGPQLQTYLTDQGRLSEFNVLLTMRGQTRRIASSPVTMSAVIQSLAASDAIFAQATALNSTACAAVVASAVAMGSVSASASTLTTVTSNSVAANLFYKSIYYETNIKNVVANLSGLVAASYADIGALVANSIPMSVIVTKPLSMQSIVVSPATVAIMAASSVSMTLVTETPSAMNIVSASTTAMPLIASSAVAMSEIVSRASAMASVANSAVAIRAVFAVLASWNAFRASAYFGDNLKSVITNLSGLNPADYIDINAVIASATAMTAISASSGSMQALSSSPAAMTTLAGSATIGIVAASATAMAVLTTVQSAMATLYAVTSSLSVLFNSSVARGAIFVSNIAINALSGTASAITWLKANKAAQLGAGPGLADATPGVFQTFNAAMPAKMLMLFVRQTTSVTVIPYAFGTASAGSTAGTTISFNVNGIDHVAAYANLTYDIKTIDAAAVNAPIATYVDMT